MVRTSTNILPKIMFVNIFFLFLNHVFVLTMHYSVEKVQYIAGLFDLNHDLNHSKKIIDL